MNPKLAALVDNLVSDPEQPIQDIMRIVYNQSVPTVENAVFDEGFRVQHDDPDRSIACVRVIERIQLHTMLGLAERLGREDAGG